MALEILCPACGETEDLTGRRVDDQIEITCESCGQAWMRPTDPVCPKCGGDDLQEVPLAIVEKSRGTQLSVVGVRIIYLCNQCDAEPLARWHAYRPNPMLPSELPTVASEDQ